MLKSVGCCFILLKWTLQHCSCHAIYSIWVSVKSSISQWILISIYSQCTVTSYLGSKYGILLLHTIPSPKDNQHKGCLCISANFTWVAPWKEKLSILGQKQPFWVIQMPFCIALSCTNDTNKILMPMDNQHLLTKNH